VKIAVITCYKQPDYVRARTLRTALAAAPDTEVLIIRNRHTGWLRFVEVPLKILRARWRERPDTYVITFRGYEMLLFMVLTFVRQPIIFDEMVNFTEWMEEQGRLQRGSLAYRLFRRWYAWLTGHCRFILADTDAHARYSAHLNRLDRSRYRTIPVGTDETVFRPQNVKKSDDQPFTVFYYGNMLPLHGLSYVLEAAVLLRDQPEINFRLVGGKRQSAVAKACATAAEQGARVTHEAWLPFDELPTAARAAGLCLGGPFGDTLQSQFVITGKTYQFLALGAPVLIGKNQVNGLFKDKANCLVVPQADAQAIVQAITWAVEHPEELRRLGRRGRQLYQQSFSQAVINHSVRQLVEATYETLK
jgi:glycosyltransferase involved in cell wall biosynthesis